MQAAFRVPLAGFVAVVVITLGAAVGIGYLAARGGEDDPGGHSLAVPAPRVGESEFERLAGPLAAVGDE